MKTFNVHSLCSGFFLSPDSVGLSSCYISQILGKKRHYLRRHKTRFDWANWFIFFFLGYFRIYLFILFFFAMQILLIVHCTIVHRSLILRAFL